MILSRPDAVTSKVEPERTVTLKFVEFTVMDWMVAVEPVTLNVTPFALTTASVVSDTSSNAANASVGASNATKIPARVSIRGIVSLFG